MAGLFHTRIYLKWIGLRHEAGQWVSAEGVKAAAEAMLVLNRYAGARYHPHRDAIYLLKNAFIHHLFHHGYCRGVACHTQTLICNACGGDGIDNDDGSDCWKCHGSGVWRSLYFYLFKFEIQGRYYSWHQPRGLVEWLDWEAVPEDLKGQAYEGKTITSDPYNTPERIVVLIATVWIFLQRQGSPVRPNLPNTSLRQALSYDLQSFWYNLRIVRLLDAWRSRTLEWWEAHTPSDGEDDDRDSDEEVTEFYGRDEFDNEEEVPF